ncbi:MAG: NAD(P)H-binding protein [Veillonellaceae bacterium]|jgi:uncharacterized protein YbjT (DUF2867 family)|nr:NAD(P)H-binding protein [Veillonellaceae bacterium]
MAQKSALLLGASGLVGGELLKLLLDGDEYQRVTILVRRPLAIQHPKLTEVVIDFNSLEQAKDKFSADDIFSCLGTTIKKAKTREAMNKVDYEYTMSAAKLAKAMDADKFLVISSIGANPNSPVWYSRLKGRLEADLKQLGLPALYVFQPSLLVGKRKEFRFGEYTAAFLSKFIPFMFNGPLKKYKPIKASTVAAGMYRAAQLPNSGIITFQSDKINQLAYSLVES